MTANKLHIIRNITTSKLIIILAFTIAAPSFLEIDLPEAFATTTEWKSEISVGILETEPSEFGIDFQVNTHSNDGDFTSLDEIEKQAIEKAYFHSDRNAAEAAKLLGISRATMYRKLKRFGYES